jgi:peptide deformylase
MQGSKPGSDRTETHAELATLRTHPDWVKTRAREIDLCDELSLAETMDRIFQSFKRSHPFVGASSNNIYWNLTRTPIRVMVIPRTAGTYITVINPKITRRSGTAYQNIEACGSIPGKYYAVLRQPHVAISGYTLEKQYLELSFGSEDYSPGDRPVLAAYHRHEWIVQHEMDHLDGITIKDKGTPFDLQHLMP